MEKKLLDEITFDKLSNMKIYSIDIEDKEHLPIKESLMNIDKTYLFDLSIQNDKLYLESKNLNELVLFLSKFKVLKVVVENINNQNLDGEIINLVKHTIIKNYKEFNIPQNVILNFAKELFKENLKLDLENISIEEMWIFNIQSGLKSTNEIIKEIKNINFLLSVGNTLYSDIVKNEKLFKQYEENGYFGKFKEKYKWFSSLVDFFHFKKEDRHNLKNIVLMIEEKMYEFLN